jgi:hypothetical protein
MQLLKIKCRPTIFGAPSTDCIADPEQEKLPPTLAVHPTNDISFGQSATEKVPTTSSGLPFNDVRNLELSQSKLPLTILGLPVISIIFVLKTDKP